MSAAPPQFDWAAFRRGMAASRCTGALVLAGSFFGFGALVRASGMEIGHGVALTLTVWALPGQVVFVSLMAAGAGLAATALAVTLTAVRLMPMVVAIMPEMRVDGRPMWQRLIAAQFTAATVWLESRRAFPGMPIAQRLPYMLGLGSVFFVTMNFMLAGGYLLSGQLPALLAAALILLTPAYFLLGLLAAARDRLDYASMIGGAALLLALHAWLPNLDMLVAGLVGGTAGFAASRLTRAR